MSPTLGLCPVPGAEGHTVAAVIHTTVTRGRPTVAGHVSSKAERFAPSGSLCSCDLIQRDLWAWSGRWLGSGSSPGSATHRCLCSTSKHILYLKKFDMTQAGFSVLGVPQQTKRVGGKTVSEHINYTVFQRVPVPTGETRGGDRRCSANPGQHRELGTGDLQGELLRWDSKGPGPGGTETKPVWWKEVRREGLTCTARPPVSSTRRQRPDSTPLAPRPRTQ